MSLEIVLPLKDTSYYTRQRVNVFHFKSQNYNDELSKLTAGRRRTAPSLDGAETKKNDVAYVLEVFRLIPIDEDGQRPVSILQSREEAIPLPIGSFQIFPADDCFLGSVPDVLETLGIAGSLVLGITLGAVGTEPLQERRGQLQDSNEDGHQGGER